MALAAFLNSKLTRKQKQTYKKLKQAEEEGKLSSYTVKIWRDILRLKWSKDPANKARDLFSEEDYNRREALRRILKRGEVDANGERFYDYSVKTRHHETIRMIYAGKITSPINNKTDWAGVEIECIYDSNKLQNTLMQEICNNKIPFTDVTTDGSLRYPENDTGARNWKLVEVRSLFRVGNGMNNIKRLCELLKSADARVNSKCGLHVHLDVRHLIGNATKQKELVERFNRALPLLASMIHPARRNNKFCKLGDNWGGKESKYYAINCDPMDSRGTLEIRLHSGTVNADKIMHWVRLLHEIKETNFDGQLRDAKDAAVKLPFLPASTVDYIAGRIELFSGSPKEIAAKNKPGKPYVDDDAEEIRLAQEHSQELYLILVNELEKADTLEKCVPIFSAIKQKKKLIEERLGKTRALPLMETVEELVALRLEAIGGTRARDQYQLGYYIGSMKKALAVPDLEKRLENLNKILLELNGAMTESRGITDRKSFWYMTDDIFMKIKTRLTAKIEETSEAIAESKDFSDLGILDLSIYLENSSQDPAAEVTAEVTRDILYSVDLTHAATRPARLYGFNSAQ